MQLAAALRAAHSARRALRAPSLLPSKVLLTSPGRIRIGEVLQRFNMQVTIQPRAAACPLGMLAELHAAARKTR